MFGERKRRVFKLRKKERLKNRQKTSITCLQSAWFVVSFGCKGTGSFFACFLFFRLALPLFYHWTPDKRLQEGLELPDQCQYMGNFAPTPP